MKHGILIGHKNVFDSPTELPNECVHPQPQGLSIIIIIKLCPDRASAGCVATHKIAEKMITLYLFHVL